MFFHTQNSIYGEASCYSNYAYSEYDPSKMNDSMSNLTSCYFDDSMNSLDLKEAVELSKEESKQDPAEKEESEQKKVHVEFEFSLTNLELSMLADEVKATTAEVDKAEDKRHASLQEVFDETAFFTPQSDPVSPPLRPRKMPQTELHNDDHPRPEVTKSRAFDRLSQSYSQVHKQPQRGGGLQKTTSMKVLPTSSSKKRFDESHHTASAANTSTCENEGQLSLQFLYGSHESPHNQPDNLLGESSHSLTIDDMIGDVHAEIGHDKSDDHEEKEDNTEFAEEVPIEYELGFSDKRVEVEEDKQPEARPSRGREREKKKKNRTGIVRSLSRTYSRRRNLARDDESRQDHGRSPNKKSSPKPRPKSSGRRNNNTKDEEGKPNRREGLILKSYKRDMTNAMTWV